MLGVEQSGPNNLSLTRVSATRVHRRSGIQYLVVVEVKEVTKGARFMCGATGPAQCRLLATNNTYKLH